MQRQHRVWSRPSLLPRKNSCPCHTEVRSQWTSIPRHFTTPSRPVRQLRLLHRPKTFHCTIAAHLQLFLPEGQTSKIFCHFTYSAVVYEIKSYQEVEVLDVIVHSLQYQHSRDLYQGTNLYFLTLETSLVLKMDFKIPMTKSAYGGVLMICSPFMRTESPFWKTRKNG